MIQEAFNKEKEKDIRNRHTDMLVTTIKHTETERNRHKKQSCLKQTAKIATYMTYTGQSLDHILFNI